MDHISGNKIPIGSIEKPIDRAHPDAKPVKFPLIGRSRRPLKATPRVIFLVTKLPPRLGDS
jgi:hypothetical protein